MGTFLYIRSSAGGAQGREDLKTQESACVDIMSDCGITSNRTFKERSVSGGFPLSKRPAGAEMLKALKAGDTVVIEKFSRLFRSAVDARNTLRAFKKTGIRLFDCSLKLYLTDSPSLEMLLSVSDAFSPTEVDTIASRIRDSKAALRETGKFQGGKVDFGFQLNADGYLIENPEEQKAVEFIKRKRKDGKSFRAISEELEKHFPGMQLSHEGVRRLVLRLEGKGDKLRERRRVSGVAKD
jgi:DNA invertase Pin-like site-specific DNA recombinase